MTESAQAPEPAGPLPSERLGPGPDVMRQSSAVFADCPAAQVGRYRLSRLQLHVVLQNDGGGFAVDVTLGVGIPA